MSHPGRWSCFPSVLLAISVAFEMPAPGGTAAFQALGEIGATHAFSVCASWGFLQNEDAACITCSFPQMTQLPLSAAAFEMYEIMVMLSCEGAAPSDAAAVGADAAFVAPFVGNTYCPGPGARPHHLLCFMVAIHRTLLRKDLD